MLHFPAYIKSPVPFLSFYLDSLSITMFLFITFLGIVVYRFAARYLNGEPQKARFLKQFALAVISAQLLVISGNLVLFGLCWISMSLCLHFLLEHYHDRPRAILSARKKFIISRIGEITLIISILCLWNGFHTLDLPTLFSKMSDPLTGYQSTMISIAALSLVFSAMCKSAQIPFHSWLPDTLEAPTPVSALMHAGIVNAGGYLLIRFSPILSHSHAALNLCVAIGTLTAIMGLLVMWTQHTIKKSLAWSTVSQMGMMILQCGLGAYGLALLHIFGHGFYKAHAFLVSGTISETLNPALKPTHITYLLARWILGISIAIFLLWSSVTLLKLSIAHWPGGWISITIFLLGISQLFVPVFKQAKHTFLQALLLAVFLLSLLLSLKYFLLPFFNSVFPQTVPLQDRGNYGQTITFVIILLFTALSLFKSLFPSLKKSTKLYPLYIHALNGFYLGLLADRIIMAIWPIANRRNRLKS